MGILELYSYSMIILLVPLIALSFVAIKFTRSGWSRLAAISLFIITTVQFFLVPVEFASYPKSVTLEWYARETKEAVVIWGGVHPDTKKIYVLLYWEGQAFPRYYTLDNFDSKKEQQQMGEALQKAMKESQKAKEKGGSGTIKMKYPFLSQKERQERMKGNGQRPGIDSAGIFQPRAGYEKADGVFAVEPPPPPNPEKQ